MIINIETDFNKAVNSFNNNILSEELNTYIINSCSFINLKNNITLNIKGINKPDEQKKIKTIIGNYYNTKYKFLKKIDKADNYIRFIMLIIGIIFILISKELQIVFSEVFLIAGWVIIWEMFYDIIFNELKRKKNAKIYKNLASANITFN